MKPRNESHRVAEGFHMDSRSFSRSVLQILLILISAETGPDRLPLFKTIYSQGGHPIDRHRWSRRRESPERPKVACNSGLI